MGKNSTPEQLEAIFHRGGNLLVSAAAGSGKTSVLIDRILGRVFDEKAPIDVDQLLVVTFSKAAAAEMRERLGKALGLMARGGKEATRAKKQQILLAKSSITTIHSFCLDAIKENFQFLDMDPGFRVADDGVEIEMLSEEVLEKLFDDLYEGMMEENPTEESLAFSKLLECYGGNRSDQEFGRLILKVYRTSMNEADPIYWMDQAVNSLRHNEKEDFGDTDQGKKILELITDILSEQMDRMSLGLETVKATEGLEGYEKNFLEEIQFLSNVLDKIGKCSWNELYEITSGFSFSRLGSAKKGTDEEAKEFSKAIRDGFKKEWEKLQKAFFYGNSETLFKELAEAAEHLEDLLRVVKAFIVAFQAEKRKRNLIDFNDMEHMALALFKDPENGVAERYRERYAEVYIDEYQDSNRVQETVLRAVSRVGNKPPEHNLFMVGDLKQSIYGFRKADPTLFKEKLTTYRKEKDVPERVIVLNKNFRSRKEVIWGANDIMSALMSEKVGDIDYSGDETLEFGATYFEENRDGQPGVSIEIIDQDEKEESLQEIEDQTLEAQYLAKRIKELIHSSYPVWDGDRGSFRPVQYRDIAVLMRSVRGFDTELEEAFASTGVPYHIDSSGGYFETLEIALIISLLRILDNPRQDIPLLSVLRSTIGNFSDSELMLLRAIDPQASFYELLVGCGEHGTEGLKEKSRRFLSRLESWRSASVYMPSDQLLWMLYEETDLYHFVGVLPKGKQRQANLRFLYEKAALYENTSFKGLFNFVKYLERQIEKEMDAEKAKLSGSGQNVVRIMSVHKSKGLEYPVVFLANTGKQFNMADSKETLLMHGKLGFGPDIFRPEERFKYPSILKESIRYEKKRESLSEEMRVLYVALTRAKEKLILVGSGKKLEERWSEYKLHGENGKVPGYLVLKGKSFLDWLMMYSSSRTELRSGKEKSGVRFSVISPAQIMDITVEGEKPSVNETGSEDEVDLLSMAAFTDSDATEKRNSEEVDRESFIKGEVQRILKDSYAFSEDTKRPGKISVTGLKRRRSEQEEALENVIEYESLTSTLSESAHKESEKTARYMELLNRKPQFMESEKSISGASLGTATHFAMQMMDFHMERSIESIDLYLRTLTERGLLSTEEARQIPRPWLLNFLNSELCERIRRSERVIREGAFKIMIPAAEAGYLTKEENGEMLLQGIVDCMFMEDGKWVVLDYKTDQYKPAEKDALIDRYRLQLDWYARAVEKCSEIDVKSKVLYLFRGNEHIEI